MKYLGRCVVLIFVLAILFTTFDVGAQAASYYEVPDILHYFGGEAYDGAEDVCFFVRSEINPLAAMENYITLLEQDYGLKKANTDAWGNHGEWLLQFESGADAAEIYIIAGELDEENWFFRCDLDSRVVQIKGEVWELAYADPSVLPDFLQYDASGKFYQRDAEAENEASFRAECGDVRYVAENYVQMLLNMGYQIADTGKNSGKGLDVYAWYLNHDAVEGSEVKGSAGGRNGYGQVFVKYNNTTLGNKTYTTILIKFGSGISYGGNTVVEIDEDGLLAEPCSACGGSGKCSHCNGTDQVKRLQAGTNTWVNQNCTYCSLGKCSFCNGRGH